MTIKCVLIDLVFTDLLYKLCKGADAKFCHFMNERGHVLYLHSYSRQARTVALVLIFVTLHSRYKSDTNCIWSDVQWSMRHPVFHTLPVISKDPTIIHKSFRWGRDDKSILYWNESKYTVAGNIHAVGDLQRKIRSLSKDPPEKISWHTQWLFMVWKSMSLMKYIQCFKTIPSMCHGDNFSLIQEPNINGFSLNQDLNQWFKSSCKIL